MSGLVRAEWLRLRKRRDLWLVALALLALSILAYFSGLANATNQMGGGFLPPDLPPDIVEQIRRENEAALLRFAFPLSIGTVVTNAQILVLALIAYLAAAVTGAEYAYGTIRTSLVANADRRGFFVVRLVALALAAVLLTGLLVILGAVLPLVASLAGTHLPAVTDPDPGSLAAQVGVFLLTAAFIIGLASLWAVLIRNAAIALVLTIAYVLIEGALVGLIVRVAGEASLVRWLLPVADLQLLSARTTESTTGASMPTQLAIGVAVAWIVAVWSASVWVLARSDIRE